MLLCCNNVKSSLLYIFFHYILGKQSKKMIKTFNKNNGFTLVEVLIALSVLLILTLLSIPSFKVSNVNNRVSGETNQLSEIFSYARSEAARRGADVSVCATVDGATCGSLNYSTGIIVYNDPGAAGLSSVTQILKVYNNWNVNDKGKITSTVNSEGNGSFTFDGLSEAVNYGTVLVCSPGYNSYTISLTQFGAINIISNVGDGGC